MEKKEESSRDITEEYAVLKSEYDLPEWQGLAEDFDVEKICEKETSFLVREIRRAMNEKLSAYLHLFETLINPASPPMFVFSVLRKISNEDKEKIKEIYKKLSKMQLTIMKLDTIYSEENEAKFVKDIFLEWQDLKKEIHEIVGKFDDSFSDDDNSSKGRYFG